jgi:16S rRNA (adenine1518-N6/adenine1519-N6)-dimethyltransferase
MTKAWRDPRGVLREAGLTAKRSFGQSFLVSEPVVRAIAEACVPDAEKAVARVVEIGAGTGALTAQLVPRARSVVAIERDRDLVPVLARLFADEIARGELELLEADAQAVDLARLLGDERPRVLAGNLPYQITGRLLERAVEAKASLDRAVFMVQAEVADRLVARAGTKAYGALTVFVRAAFEVTRVMTVSRGSFHPPPDVTSSVVRLVPAPRAEETDAFRQVVRRAFGARRKTLRNAWSGLAPPDVLAHVAREAGVSLDARGETLEVEAFARVAALLSETAGLFPPP